MAGKFQLNRATAQRAFVDMLFLLGGVALTPFLLSSRSYSIATLLPVAVGAFALRYMMLRGRAR